MVLTHYANNVSLLRNMLQFKVGRKKKPKLSLKQLFCEFISFNAVIAVDIKL